MTEQFHEGQDVEVAVRIPIYPNKNDQPAYYELHWRKAKIVKLLRIAFESRDGPVPASYLVEFADRDRAVFGAEHIRTLRQGVYGEWCYDPNLCAEKGYCPRDPTCADCNREYTKWLRYHDNTKDTPENRALWNKLDAINRASFATEFHRNEALMMALSARSQGRTP